MSYARENFEVTKTDGGYKLKAARTGSYHAYWSSYPSGFCDDNDVGEFSDSIEVNDPIKGRRCYFHIMGADSYSVAATRLWLIKSLPNLRELGGYNTADGESFVKYGQLYRSDRLCQLEGADTERFLQLGIRQIVDFRVDSEIKGKEDPEFRGIDYLNTPPIAQDNHCFNYSFEDVLRESSENIKKTREALYEQYREMAFGSRAYRDLFRFIARDKTPILFHCTAGKDRTGVAAALILLLLGVPRDTIVYDYMLTCTARKEHIDEAYKVLEKRVRDASVLEFVESLLSVQQSSIESTLDAVLGRYPNTDDYFVKELGLTADELSNIRKKYLTKHVEQKV
ncbi:MAG: tyrosine-protein phosphatase [Oscillospiraceae bacterium]